MDWNFNYTTIDFLLAAIVIGLIVSYIQDRRKYPND